MSNSFQSSSPPPWTTYYNASVPTASKNCILLNPLFILVDYDMMWKMESV